MEAPNLGSNIKNGPKSLVAGAMEFVDNALGNWRSPTAQLDGERGEGNADTSRRRIEANHTLHLHDQTNIWVEEAVGEDWKTPGAVPRGGSADRIEQKKQDPKLGPQVNLEDQADAWPEEALHWPTALTTDSHGHEYQQRRGVKTDTLAGAAKNWATPLSVEGTKAPKLNGKDGQQALNRQVKDFGAEAREKNWQTPMGSYGGSERRSGKRYQNDDDVMLNEQARLWPELVKSDQSSPQPVTIGTLGKKLREMGARFRLNPQFAEWLMGLPLDWISRDPNSCD